MGVVLGLDFNAVMVIGAARGADLAMLADILPACEAAILAGRTGADLEDGDG